jgi:hypothetical protein
MMSSSMSMCSKVCSLGGGNFRGIGRDSVHNVGCCGIMSGISTGVMTTIRTFMVLSVVMVTPIKPFVILSIVIMSAMILTIVIVAAIKPFILSIIMMTSIKPFMVLSIILMTAIKSFMVLSIIMMTTISSTIMTTISTIIWSNSGSFSSCTVSSEVGSFSYSDLWGVVDWQGCRVGYSGGVGVAIVPGASVRHGGGQQAEEGDLKRNNIAKESVI